MDRSNDKQRFIRCRQFKASFEHNDINYPLKLVKLHHFIENWNTQTLLHKMNDDNAAQQLIDAIDKNDIPTVSSLISSGSVNLNGEPWPLHLAARHGRVEIMALLLDAGADINTVDKYQHTSCHIAIVMNHFDVFKLLVERGANLGVVDSAGRSLLSTVARIGTGERFVNLLLDAGVPIDHLSNFQVMKLVKSVAVFNRLMARGVNFTAMRDEDGATLCHFIARNVSVCEDLRWLVAVCGAGINAADFAGDTPLHWAALYSNESAMRVLVEMGAGIDIQSRIGWSALHTLGFAETDRSSTCAELLLALGIDVSLVNSDEETACHVAAAHGNLAALRACLAARGDFDQLNNYGTTPRALAIREPCVLPTADDIDAARRRIAKIRLDLVRQRAGEICVGLQSLHIDALQLCEVLLNSFGALGSLIAFHQFWKIATTVKHFCSRSRSIVV